MSIAPNQVEELPIVGANLYLPYDCPDPTFMTPARVFEMSIYEGRKLRLLWQAQEDFNVSKMADGMGRLLLHRLRLDGFGYASAVRSASAFSIRQYEHLSGAAIRGNLNDGSMSLHDEVHYTKGLRDALRIVG